MKKIRSPSFGEDTLEYSRDVVKRAGRNRIEGVSQLDKLQFDVSKGELILRYLLTDGLPKPAR